MAKLFNLAGMSTATTGTGTITLGSAMYGHKTFADAGVSDGETITYAIKDGAASEIGRGVYTASGTTLTRTVLKSTNSDAAIDLSGSAEVFITPAAEDIIEPPSSSVDGEIVLFSGTTGDVLKRASTTGMLKATSGVLAQATAGTDYVAPSAVRDVLTGNRTYYVRTDGSDSNDGLTDTSGGAFLTIQKAVDVVAGLDTATYAVTVQVGNGTYSEVVTLKQPVGAAAPMLRGDPTTPSNVTIGGSGRVQISGGVLGWGLDGFNIDTTGTYGILCYDGAKLTVYNMKFTNVNLFAVSCQNSGSQITLVGDVEVADSALFYFYYCIFCAVIQHSCSSFNHSTTTAYSGAFAYAEGAGVVRFAGSFTGSATGIRSSTKAGVIQTGGLTLPGDTAGTDTNGGQTYS